MGLTVVRGSTVWDCERAWSEGCRRVGGVSSAAVGELRADEFERVGGLVDEAEVAGDDVTVGVLGPCPFNQTVEVKRVFQGFGANGLLWS